MFEPSKTKTTIGILDDSPFSKVKFRYFEPLLEMVDSNFPLKFISPPKTFN